MGKHHPRRLHAGVRQDGLAPYTCYCFDCGARWEPSNARGKDHPTDNSIDREVRKHMTNCEGPANG